MLIYHRVLKTTFPDRDYLVVGILFFNNPVRFLLGGNAMGVEVSIKDHRMETTFYGDLKFSDVMLAVNFAGAHPMWDSVKSVLVDFRYVEKYELSYEHALISSLIGKESIRESHKFCYALVVNDSDLKNLCQIYICQFEGSGAKCRVFERMSDAQEWLSDP